jgi:hypothetical protein
MPLFFSLCSHVLCWSGTPASLTCVETGEHPKTVLRGALEVVGCVIFWRLLCVRRASAIGDTTRLARGGDW